MPGSRQVSRKGRLGARKSVLAIRSRQVETARSGGGLKAPDLPAHLELVFSLDPVDLLVEVIGDIELAAIVHFAILHAPCRERVSREPDTRCGIGVTRNP